MDIELIFGIGFLVMLALIFLMLGLNARTLKTTDKVFKTFFLISSGIMWGVMAIFYPAIEQTYYFLGWIFAIPAIFCFVMGGVSIFEVYKHVTTEDWEKEKGDVE